MEILNQFGIKPILLAAQVVNFLILLYILKRFLYGPILKVLNERKNKIANSLKNAEEIEKRLQAIGEKEAESIAKSAREGEKIIKEAQDSAVSLIEEGQAKAVSVAEKIVADGRAQLTQDRDKMISELKSNFVNLFDLAQEKIAGKSLTKEQKASLEKTVKELK